MDKFLDREEMPWISNRGTAAAPDYNLVDLDKFKFKKM